MKTSSRWNYRSIVFKSMMGLALAALVGIIDVAPASARGGGGHEGGRQSMGRHDGGRSMHGGYNRGYSRGYRPYGRGYGYGYGYRPYGYGYGYGYGYPRRVYVAPPVVYAPPPPPGVGIFLPSIVINP